jgi:uncharacterized RDD family membrane protein YckC
MVERKDVGSWLEGPRAASGAALGYPGERLGRPEAGRGSVGRFGRRLLGLLVDWVGALAIARLIGRDPWVPLLVLFVEHTLLVGTAGFTVGHRLVGLRVVRLDGRPPGMGRAALRALLLCLAVPALIWDRDQRGLHDRAAGTLLERTGPPSEPAPRG